MSKEDSVPAEMGAAHQYFSHPEKGDLISVPVYDVDTSGMYCYFAQFMPDEEDPETYDVMFPDLPGCLTTAFGLKQAMAQSIDALSGYLTIMLSDKGSVPPPSDYASVKEKAEFLNMEMGLESCEHALYLLVPAWPDI